MKKIVLMLIALFVLSTVAFAASTYVSPMRYDSFQKTVTVTVGVDIDSSSRYTTVSVVLPDLGVYAQDQVRGSGTALVSLNVPEYASGWYLARVATSNEFDQRVRHMWIYIQ